MQLFALGSRFALAVLFLTAGLAKLSAPAEFARAVANYRLLPSGPAGAVATWLPRLEVAAAVLLGLGLATTLAGVVLAGLLLAFTAAVAVNLLRGREIVDADPRPLVRGLIHSDGCRVLNWVKGTPYPRYHFTNESLDIRAMVASTAAVAGALVLAEALRTARAAAALARPDPAGSSGEGAR